MAARDWGTGLEVLWTCPDCGSDFDSAVGRSRHLENAHTECARHRVDLFPTLRERGVLSLGRAVEQCERLTKALRREQARNVELATRVEKLEFDIEHRAEEWRRGFKRLLRRLLAAVDEAEPLEP